jgi:hypothetical protein
MVLILSADSISFVVALCNRTRRVTFYPAVPRSAEVNEDMQKTGGKGLGSCLANFALTRIRILMKQEPIELNAPRFHAYWESIEGKRVLIMKRQDLESLDFLKTAKVALRLEKAKSLPISRIFQENKFIGGTIRPTGEKFSIKIYREDPKDYPTPVNVDTYNVWVGLLPTYFDVPKMILNAATRDDSNFAFYASDHVFFVKEDPGSDHWLEHLPPEVQMLLSREDDQEN